MDVVRLVFWILACLFLVPFVAIAWIVLFWVSPDDHARSEEDGFCFEEETLEYENG
jgi:phage shock protein PspC (stress-responsive transcriptional regulator)